MKTTTRHRKRNIFTLLLTIISIIMSAAYLVWAYVIQPIVKSQQEETGKLNAILNSIADGVIVQNLAGQVETMNPSARTIIDNTISSFSPTRKMDDQTRQARSKARLSSLLSFLTNLQFFKTQNVEIGQRVLSAQAAPIIAAEEKLGSVVILRDITAEVESKKLKDDFITTISHELRTPLSVIKGYNDLLKMNAHHVVAEQRPMFLQNIDSVDKHIADLLVLIEQMLDLTQINAGDLGIDLEQVNLSDVVKSETELWRQHMAARKLAYAVHLPDEAIWVKGDEDRLSGVIHNLLKNAHNYTLPGGQVEISICPEAHHVQVDVRDTGVGIAEKDQPFIFSRFFRAIHSEDTYEVSGAGLGLFLSRAIIEAHGGKIWFESEANQGSTFSFLLPRISANSDGQA